MKRKMQASVELSAAPLTKKRGRKPRSRSPLPVNTCPLSFFKVLIGDFKDVLFIPPMAVCTLKGLAKKYVYIEDTDGKYWNVKMSVVDGSLAFHNGWSDFVSDHSITVGEIVLFTYNGGLIFAARIFGTNALERVNFKVNRRKGRCAKERCITEVKPCNVRSSKRKKTAQASEEQQSPFSTEIQRSLKRKQKSVKCDFPKIHVIESDSISEGVLELSSAGEKPLYDSNSKESENELLDSEQTMHKNSNATVGELNIKFPTELANSDLENIEAVASKSIINKMSTSENGAALQHISGALPSKQTVEEPDANDNKEWSAEISGSQVQMNKEHDDIRNNGKTEQSLLQDLEILDSEPHDMKMASLSNLEHAECSPKMELNLIKPEGISEIVSGSQVQMNKEHDDIRNNGKTEQSLLHDLEILDSEPHDMKMASLSNLEHAEFSPKMELNLIKPEGISEIVSGSQVQMNKEHDDIRNNGKTEQSLLQDLEILDSEPHDMKMASLSNLEHAECSPKMELNLIKPEGISEIVSGSQVQMNKEHDDIRNNGKTEQSLLQDLEILDSEPDDMKMASLSNLEHAECSPKMELNLIKPEGISDIVSGSQVQMNKEHDDIRNNGKTEQSLLHDLEILDSEPHDMKMASLSNLEHAECSPKMELNLIKTEGISEIVSGSQVQMNKEHDDIRNNGKTEQSLLHDLEILDSEPHDMKMASLSNLEHAECSPKMELNLIKPEGISEIVSGSQVQMNKEHDDIKNSGMTEQGLSHDLEMLDSESHDMKMASLSNLEHAECSPKKELNLIKPEGISEIVFLSADAICHPTLDEKLIELATGASFNANELEEPICRNYHASFGLETSVSCQTISAVCSNPILNHTINKMENLMIISEEYEVPQTTGSSTIAESGLQSCNKVHECKYKSYPEIVKGSDCQSGISDDTFFDEDEKNVTPCSSRRCKAKIDRTDSVGIPSSSCVSFSVCLSDDVQSLLELPKKLACPLGKLKHDRKVIVLQDPSMRCWPVLYHESNKFLGFIGGWVDFARENNICRGDICEFELRDKMELKFSVHITKAERSIFDEEVE